jgi:hypothetical protein
LQAVVGDFDELQQLSQKQLARATDLLLKL